MVDAGRFVDDLNAYVRDQRFSVRLTESNIVSQTIAENIVDPIEFTPRSRERAKL